MSYGLYVWGTKGEGAYVRELETMHITHMGSREGRMGSGEEGKGEGGEEKRERELGGERGDGRREAGRGRVVCVYLCGCCVSASASVCACVCVRCFSVWMACTAPAYTFLRNLPNSLEMPRQGL